MVEISKHEFEGSYSVTFDCDTPADEAVEAADHIPNGYFWEGVARRLVEASAPEIAEAFDYDCEGSMFCAYGDDAAVLDVVIGLMTPVINDPARVTEIITAAEADGFEFED